MRWTRDSNSEAVVITTLHSPSPYAPPAGPSPSPRIPVTIPVEHRPHEIHRRVSRS